MSDIPLHIIRPEQAGNSYSYNGSMSTSRRKQDNKRNGKYAGDNEEEAGLLAAQYDAEDEYDEQREIMSPVRQSFPFCVFLISNNTADTAEGTSEYSRTPRE